eukprot:CAMPEP_0176051556 /NCGR_PEP_ID=MMETSP0120_2-20121206/25632_1 /TAXON_ID=160619 /ORGANISM="Kryptoperidinium foliaceum, Strain CCMP 1326" /LENGTH=34 /DNA_ID= /DNA_START= /DNA_END= /DNA_ORIENTATION=
MIDVVPEHLAQDDGKTEKRDCQEKLRPDQCADAA